MQALSWIWLYLYVYEYVIYSIDIYFKYVLHSSLLNNQSQEKHFIFNPINMAILEDI